MLSLLRECMRGLHRNVTSRRSVSAAASRVSRPRRRNGRFEQLEARTLLAVTGVTDLADLIAQPAAAGQYTTAQITSAYLANSLSINTLKGRIVGDGSGQTIAIVDAYNAPNLVGDLARFDAKFGLPAPPTLTIVSQTGGNRLPSANVSWALETSLDVQWAHAMAPRANILLVEANSASVSDLLTAVNYARNAYVGASPVTVVSMSWGASEFRSETSYDSYFTTPAGHPNVTFVAASGDNGRSGTWPSVSPNVLAVGGTTLSVSSSGSYVSETAWSGSSGGVSRYEALPSYQRSTGISASGRVTPDVSYNANPNTGYLVYDSLGYGGWVVIGGTSAGAPQWSAILAIANQARAANGQGPLSQANAALYALYTTKATQDFHDIVTGSNRGYRAGTGFDAVTGLGSPIVAALVSDLAGGTSASTRASTATTASPSRPAWWYQTPWAGPHALLGPAPATNRVADPFAAALVAIVAEPSDGFLGDSFARIGDVPPSLGSQAVPQAGDRLPDGSPLRRSPLSADRPAAGLLASLSMWSDDFSPNETAGLALAGSATGAAQPATALTGHRVDWIFARSASAESEAAAVERRPALAPEDVDSPDLPPAGQPEIATPTAGAETAAPVGLHAAAVLILARHVRRPSADPDANARRADFRGRR
jgi:hypothetical protein